MTKGQLKRHSVIEITVNLITGLLLSIYIVQPLVFLYYDIHLSIGDNWNIAIIFTAVSWIRGYVVRRVFNWYMIRSL